MGPTKLVAKLGSTRAKPDGVIVVRAGEVIEFLHPLPVGALWGVGQKTADTLDRLGIRLVGDVARTPMPILERVLGEGQAAALRALANGEDVRAVVPFEAPKSVSHEETYARDLDDPDEIRRQILDLSHRVAVRLRADGYRARTVTLKLRLPSFSTLTRSKTMPDPTDVGADLYHVAAELYANLPPGRRRFRLIGVAATGLVPAGAEQISLVTAGRWGDAERAVDRVRGRFGPGTAIPAVLLRPEGRNFTRRRPPPRTEG